MLAGLGREDDKADTLDLQGRGITKLDKAAHVRVQVGEEFLLSGHAVHSTGVEVPAIDLVIVGHVVEEDVGAQHVKMEQSSCRQCGRRKTQTFSPSFVSGRSSTLSCTKNKAGSFSSASAM
jgi:hypothetical protein